MLAITRGKGLGFAGIENALYFTDHTWMLLGDAKEIVSELVKQLAAASGMAGGRGGIDVAPPLVATRCAPVISALSTPTVQRDLQISPIEAHDG